MTEISPYYDLERSRRAAAEARHRSIVGGMWEQIGKLQFDFLVGRGLRPNMRLIDIGCGCLRGGVHFIAYLDAGHYYGIDISRDLLDAGYNVELPLAGLQHKLPRDHLASNADFNAAEFGVTFDIALAQLLFTHPPRDLCRRCMSRAADHVKAGGRFFGTVFLAPAAHDVSQPHAEEIAAWNRPRGQIMLIFRRTAG